MRRIGWLVAVTSALAGAAPASAAYAPQLAFSVSPATANTAAAITSTITQADGETPSKTVTVSLPPGFTPNAGNRLGICSAAQQTAGCPADSQMGTASATVSAFGLARSLSGPVFFGGPSGPAGAFQLIVVLMDPALGNQTLTGFSSLRPDGGVNTVFDNLPNFLATSFTLALAGGDKALLKTPSTCGSFPVTAAFVSQTGEQASGTAPVTIASCSAPTAPSSGTPSPAAPGAPAAAPLRVGAPRLTRGGVVTFTLSAPAKVTVTVTRAGKRVGHRSVSGRTGANRARLGRRLKAGRYVVTLAALDAKGKKVTRRSTVRVR